MKLAIASALLLSSIAAYSQGPTPGPAKVGEPPKQQSAEKQQGAGRPSERSDAGPSISVSVSPVIGAHPAKDAANKDGESSPPWWKIVGDVLLVVFTGVLAYATVKLMSATKDNAEAAKKNAEAAKGLIDATYATEAPFLIPKVMKVPDVVQNPAAVRGARYVYINQGRTPGIIVRFQDAVRFLVGNHPVNPETLFVGAWETQQDVYFPVGAGHEASMVAGEFKCDIVPGDAQAAIQGNPQGRFLLLGRVRYVDLFGNAREQLFCLKFRQDGSYTRFGGPPYNYDKAVD